VPRVRSRADDHFLISAVGNVLAGCALGQADEDSAEQHRSVSNERVQNFFEPSSDRRHNSLKAIIVNNFK
jgi:hypothetical protein